jgi:hypothetical protein
MQLETDQDTCHDTLGNQIDCRDSGQDASHKRSGKTLFTNRFAVTGNSVKDNLTGMEWKKHANLSEFPLSWPEAQHYVQELNAPEDASDNAWRLPARRELFSLISHQQVNPTLPRDHPFSNVFNGYYWTGTTCARLPDQAWYVHMGGGRVYRGMKHGSYMMWPVRGDMQSYEAGSDRFTSINDTFFDCHTNRHWYAGGGLMQEPRTWQDAIHTIRKLNDAHQNNYSDWRLPNIRELESLVDDRRHSPAFAPGFSITTSQIAGFWSSTTSLYEPRYAWVLYIVDGAIGVGFKAQTEFHTLAVRD